MPTRTAEKPTFTYQGQRFFWGYSPDRQMCGLWEVDAPDAAPHKSWPISEHEEAWGVFRSLEPGANAYSEEVRAETRAAPQVARPAATPVATPPATARPAVSSPRVAPGPTPLFETDVITVGAPGTGAAPATNGVAHDVGSDNLGESNGHVQTHATWQEVVPSDLGDFTQPTFSNQSDDLTAGGSSKTRWKRLALVVALSVVVVVAALYGVKKFHSSPATVVDPAHVVLTAATTTEAHHTAHMTMVETITGVKGASTVTVPASGEVDFASDDASFTMTVAGQHMSLVSSDGTLYMNIPDVSKVVPGASWVSVPEGNSGAAAGGAASGGDPEQMLRFLASEGNTVSSIGSSTVDGVPVQGYLVVIAKSAVESEIARSGLPQAQVQAADAFLNSVGPMTFRVYVDSMNELRQMDFAMSLPGVASGSVSVDMTFSDFGAPVSVSPPPPSQVTTFSQFLAAAAKAAGF